MSNSKRDQRTETQKLCRQALRGAVRQLTSLRCSHEEWTVGYKEATETIAECNRALAALGAEETK